MREQSINTEGARRPARTRFLAVAATIFLSSTLAVLAAGVQPARAGRPADAGAKRDASDLNLCCCPDPDLGTICREVAGPCPPCF